MSESCESHGGFLLTHSMGGGTGSGLTSNLLEKLHNDYKKEFKLELAVAPSRISFLKNVNLLSLIWCQN